MRNASEAVLRFDPEPGSFWEKHKKDPMTAFIHPEGDTSVAIGQISLKGRSKFFWESFETPVKINTKRKTPPKVKASRFSRRFNRAVWCIRKTH